MDQKDIPESSKADYRCTNCQNLANDGLIRCAQCKDEVILCLQCFACSIELGSHKEDHNYTALIPELSKELHLFETGWTFDEDDTLLDAVEQYGFGNWYDVASYVKTKDDKECEEHYVKYYVDGNIGQGTMLLEKPLACIDETVPKKGSQLSLVPPPELTVQEQQELGYMVLRDDFEREYDNDAELMISDLSLHYTDMPEDTAFKVSQVDMYRQRLIMREKRKSVAKRYSVLHDSTSLGFRSYCVARKKRLREEKLFHSKFQVFARYINKKDYHQLYRNLMKQRKLMNQLKTLMKFNEKGVKNFSNKYKVHAMRMNGNLNGAKKRRRKRQYCYK